MSEYNVDFFTASQAINTKSHTPGTQVKPHKPFSSVVSHNVISHKDFPQLNSIRPIQKPILADNYYNTLIGSEDEGEITEESGWQHLTRKPKDRRAPFNNKNTTVSRNRNLKPSSNIPAKGKIAEGYRPSPKQSRSGKLTEDERAHLKKSMEEFQANFEKLMINAAADNAGNPMQAVNIVLENIKQILVGFSVGIDIVNNDKQSTS
ncbi:hypothetical protein J6590_056520 [Homalodisca vitripennis]|nr:hypothetical protein J6590_056520 [Homalodisca vitripennis]